jgi:hypothetical protein
MAPHFGSKVTDTATYEKAVREEKGGANVFGSRVRSSIPEDGPTNRAKRNSEFGPLTTAGAHASDTKGKPTDSGVDRRVEGRAGDQSDVLRFAVRGRVGARGGRTARGIGHLLRDRAWHQGPDAWRRDAGDSHAHGREGRRFRRAGERGAGARTGGGRHGAAQRGERAPHRRRPHQEPARARGQPEGAEGPRQVRHGGVAGGARHAGAGGSDAEPGSEHAPRDGDGHGRPPSRAGPVHTETQSRGPRIGVTETDSKETKASAKTAAKKTRAKKSSSKKASKRASAKTEE